MFHIHQHFGHQIASINFILIGKTLFFECSCLIRNFISLITPKAQFVRLLMHKSTVPLVFFKSPRYLYDSISLITWPFKIFKSFPFELVYCCYTASPFVHFYPSENSGDFSAEILRQLLPFPAFFMRYGSNQCTILLNV